jgi:exo-beta-1,3-glucanase (GH17 family)
MPTQLVNCILFPLCPQLTSLDRRGGSHLNSLVKRDDLEVINEVYEEVVVSEEIVVFVNQFGTPFSTVTMPNVETTIWSTVPLTTITPSHSTTTSSTTSTTTPTSPSKVNPATVIPQAPPATENLAQSDSNPTPSVNPVPVAPKPEPTSHSTTTTAALSPPSLKPPAPPSPPKAAGYGFSYSPYTANNACKSAQQIATDFAAIPNIWQYSIVRIYGTDCNQVATVLPAANAHGLKLMAGIFDLNTLDSEIAIIVAAANGNWSSFDTISVGNEIVNSGIAPASTVVAAVGSARSQLRAAGFHGSVVTVDTLVASRANPSLCDASDYCAVNCHPFFDGNVEAVDSGNFLNTQMGTLRDALSNKNQRIMITETGWPWRGSTNGKAVPSPENQAAALTSIKGAFTSHPQDVVLFTSYNDLWKKSSAYTFNADQFWGFLGYAPSG